MEYVSCEWIESRLVLEQKHLKFCCIGHSGSKGYVPACEYDGGPLPVEKIEAARAQLIRDNNTDGVDTGCKGCHFLQKKDWAKERKTKALLDTVYVSNFSICNLSCRYCFVYLNEFTEVSNVAGYPLLPVFEELVGKGYLAEDGKIEWGGGEPTIVKGFAEIMRMLMRSGHTQQIHTSSVKFSPELAEALRLGKTQAVTSVDAGTRATYKEVKGRDRFDIVWENVGKYAATGGPMSVKYILRKNNSDPENVRGFIAKCKEHGVRNLVLTPDFREITQKEIGPDTIHGFALMVQEAERAGIPVSIRDEYLNPEHMALVSRYIPLAQKAWRYHLDRAVLVARREAERLTRGLRRRLARRATRRAIEDAERLLAKEVDFVHPLQLLEEPPESQAEILRLLERQTRTPDRALGAKLAEIVTSRNVCDTDDRPAVMGVTLDDWTMEGKPGYVVLDASRSPKPVQHDLWFTCWAGPGEYPIRLTLSDGESEDYLYTFHEPQALRVPLPEVPAGQSRIYAVKTDKTWSHPDSPGARRGVRITSGI